jgi:hypothetical protein
MFQSGVFLSSSDVASLSRGSQAEIFNIFGGKIRASSQSPEVKKVGSSGAYTMSLQLAEEFIEGCGNKIINTLKKIVEMEGVFFGDDLEVKMKVGRLSGVYTGITNRLRKLTDDPGAKLFDWTFDDEKDQWRGELHPMTLTVLRSVLS